MAKQDFYQRRITDGFRNRRRDDYYEENNWEARPYRDLTSRGSDHRSKIVRFYRQDSMRRDVLRCRLGNQLQNDYRQAPRKAYHDNYHHRERNRNQDSHEREIEREKKRLSQRYDDIDSFDNDSECMRSWARVIREKERRYKAARKVETIDESEQFKLERKQVILSTNTPLLKCNEVDAFKGFINVVKDINKVDQTDEEVIFKRFEEDLYSDI